jgi:hypothetical protein
LREIEQARRIRILRHEERLGKAKWHREQVTHSSPTAVAAVTG